jgi:glycosyltransferase involved in cell wall biosynthesis
MVDHGGGNPSFAILLSTLNGARFLDGQLASFARQTAKGWVLYVSDDGSTDGTMDVLQRFRGHIGPDRVTIRAGPDSGFVANFLSLVCDPQIGAQYYAFSDQDDVWEDDKLARAGTWLAQVPQGVPAVYCSRTRLIDDCGREIGLSPLFSWPPAFANALVQNIAGGNTMVFNEAARQLLIKAGGVVDVPSHDWWLYLVVAAQGGLIHYDHYCSVRYRRHGRNIVGSNIGFAARIRRAGMLLQGLFRDWTDRNLAALEPFRACMSDESRRIFDVFCTARKQGLWKRLAGVRRSGVYRQTVFGSIGLVVGVVLNKI